jgi:cell division ATPase FtsA
MPATVTLRRDIDPEDLLVIVLISSRHLTGIVALMSDEFGTKVIAHKRTDVPWHDLEEREQRTAVGEIVTKACDSAGVEARSVYFARSEVSISSRVVSGDVSFEGIIQAITEHEMDWSLRRAQEKPVGTDQEQIDIIPVKWECHGVVPRTSLKKGITVKLTREQKLEARRQYPLGEECKGLSCHALQIIARRGYRAELDDLARSLSLRCDGVIAQPAALYRGISARLMATGWSLVIDCGARHTSFLLRSGERLLRIRSYDFGGDDITRRLMTELKVDETLAESLKREVDINASGDAASAGQQLIWTDVMAQRHTLLPQAARICRAAIVDFFGRRAQDLQEDPENPLPRRGHIHLVGRASQLGGLTALLHDVFGLDVILGTGGRERRDERDVGEELENLLLSGLVVSAIEQRRAAREREGRSLARQASGVWSWLMRPFE